MEQFIREMVLEEVEKKNKEYIGRGEVILPQTRKFKYSDYLRALVILEVKSMKSSVVYTDIVTLIDRIDCFGSFKQIDIKIDCMFLSCHVRV